MEFRFIPVVSGQMTEKDVADQAAALDETAQAGAGLLPLGRALRQSPRHGPGIPEIAFAAMAPPRPGAQPGVLNTEVASGTA